MKEDKKNKSKEEEEEQRLYYFENGLMVFTANHHLQRGYCCGNRCRHCPFNYKNVK
ncbi:MAG: hypothetical protein ACJAT1_002392 [Marivirga sp.]|jgi:hypothetical protein